MKPADIDKAEILPLLHVDLINLPKQRFSLPIGFVRQLTQYKSEIFRNGLSKNRRSNIPTSQKKLWTIF